MKNTFWNSIEDNCVCEYVQGRGLAGNLDVTFQNTDDVEGHKDGRENFRNYY